MSWLPTIGLEVHVQLGSKTKIFCSCSVEFGAPGNKNVCPVCLGLPGSLPVLNEEVFRLGLRAVLALGGTPSPLVKFDRKNYFYPDLPKGYQISQFDHPLGRGGSIEIETGGQTKRIRLNRLHLEEDAGKLLHDLIPNASAVDLNRAGTPLAEIVSEADIVSSDEAYEYLTNLKAILKCVGVSECDMEKGQLRCDANVSVRKNTSDPWGTRVEIKNLNSFKAVKAAIEHEIERQSDLLEKGGKIAQETVLWDDARQKTVTMRSKEEAHDYRYFPEPDLVPFILDKKQVEETRAKLPKLPKELKEELIAKKVTPYNASLLVQDGGKMDLFHKLSDGHKLEANVAANIINNALSASTAALNTGFEGIDAAHVAAVQQMIESNEISQQAANTVIYPELVKTGKDPRKIVEEKGLKQVSDTGELEKWILEAIAANPKVVGDFKSGKETAAMFLVGQVMKKSQGKANPIKVKELMTKKLQEA